MQTPSRDFHALHHTGEVLLLPNVWDAASAWIAQRAGAAALATRSAAMAWSCGYVDGGALPREALMQRLAEILRVASVPVTVDLEDGYSDAPAAVATLVATVAELGVAGINLEDGSGTPELFEAKLQAIRSALGGVPLFINARTDVYLAGLASGAQAVRMTIERLSRYQQAGADSGFVPVLREEHEIAAVAGSVDLPLNVMTVAGLPGLDVLRRVGVRRLSAGPATFLATFHAFQQASLAYLTDGTIRGEMLGFTEMNALRSVGDS